MRRGKSMAPGVVMLTSALGVGGAWAEAKVTVTREENKPQPLEIKAGEEVWLSTPRAGRPTSGSPATMPFSSTSGVVIPR